MALDKLTQITTSGINSTTPLSGINVTGIITASSLSVSGITTGAAATFDSVDVLGVLTYDDVTNVDALGIVTARSGVRVTGGNVGIGTESPHAKLEVSGGQNQTANQFTDLVSIAANANNDALDAEVQLNFGISPSHTSTANRKARIQSVTHSGTVTPLLINPAGGRVGIGTDDPQGALDVRGNDIRHQGLNPYITFHQSDGTNSGYLQSRSTELRLNSVGSIPLTLGTDDTERTSYHIRWQCWHRNPNSCW